MIETKRPLPPIQIKKLDDTEIIRLYKEFCDFCILEKGYSKYTILCYKYSFKALIDYIPNLSSIQDVNEGLIRQFFYQGKKEKNWSNNTILHHRKNMSPFFNWCVKNGYLAENPFKNIEKPKMESKIPEFYTDEEIEKIMYYIQEHSYPSEFLKKRNYALIALFLMAGLRRGELIGLKITDINWEANLLLVRGENSKAKRDRIIPLSQRLKEILMAYREERQKLNKNTIRFFASFNRDVGFTEHGLQHLLDKLQKKTGIHIHAHKFRHTFATKSLESNMNINTVKELLGHTDIKTTAIYLHTTVKHLRQEVEKNRMNCLI